MALFSSFEELNISLVVLVELSLAFHLFLSRTFADSLRTTLWI
jgi:hypothetical protein